MRPLLGLIGAVAALAALDLLMLHHGGGLPVSMGSVRDLQAFNAVWMVAGSLAAASLVWGARPWERVFDREATAPLYLTVAAGLSVGLGIALGHPLGGMAHAATTVAVGLLAARSLGTPSLRVVPFAWSLLVGPLLTTGDVWASLTTAFIAWALWCLPLNRAVAIGGFALALGATAAGAGVGHVPVSPWNLLGPLGAWATALNHLVGWPVGLLLFAFNPQKTWLAVLAGAAAVFTADLFQYFHFGGTAALLAVFALFMGSLQGLVHLTSHRTALLILLCLTVVTTSSNLRHRVVAFQSAGR